MLELSYLERSGCMKYYISTLGCKVNTYESSVICDILTNAGFTKVSTPSLADICIVNTCTVTNTADNKSLKVVRQMYRYNENAIIVVCGCMAQKDASKVKNIPGVAVILGNRGKTKIVDYINEFLANKKQIIDISDLSNVPFENMKLNNFEHTRAFVKIQDGCNNFCSYCIIPYTRGNVRSKERKDVLEEVNNLVKQGHKEVVLTGIHTGNYGAEFDNYHLADLLLDILKIKGLERLRISSIEITELNDKVLDILKDNSILVDHLHIPLQSGSNHILKLMNRKYDKEYFIDKINKIRTIRPNISITTDIIVGFPGETEEDFLETIATAKTCKFSKIHVFPYSLREGTKAEQLPNHISEEVKKERVKKLIEISKELEIDYMNKFKGAKVIFIPETIKENYLYGHTGNYLYIRAKGCKEMLHKDIEVIVKKINYPYVDADIIS